MMNVTAIILIMLAAALVVAGIACSERGHRDEADRSSPDQGGGKAAGGQYPLT